MRKFLLVTDSTCDLDDEYIKDNNLTILNLGYRIENVNYTNIGDDKLSTKDFYAKLRDGLMPTTSQVNPETAFLTLQPYAEKGEDILIIGFSSALSGTYNSFVTASKMLNEKYPDVKVYVIDSLCASLGEGLLVDYAVKKADSGASIEEVRDYVENLKLHICHYFTVESLFHLHRGGRVSKTSAIIGSILNIKPVLHVDEKGRLINIGKVMGRKKSLSALVDGMAKKIGNNKNEKVFISHGDCIEDANYVAQLVKEKFGIENVYINDVGPVIGAHSGAGTVALFFIGNDRAEEKSGILSSIIKGKSQS